MSLTEWSSLAHGAVQDGGEGLEPWNQDSLLCVPSPRA